MVSFSGLASLTPGSDEGGGAPKVWGSQDGGISSLRSRGVPRVRVLGPRLAGGVRNETIVKEG
jgi:hypothetical protein